MVLGLLLSGAAPAQGGEIDATRPMYGASATKKDIIAFETDFMNKVMASGLGLEDYAAQQIQIARAAFQQKDLPKAMQEFNRAWLLDSDNGDSYDGFALLYHRMGKSEMDIGQFFETAISKQRHSADVHLHYAQFLSTQRFYDRSIKQAQTALERQPSIKKARTHIAFVFDRKGDFDNACSWAKQAQENQEEVPEAFVNKVCRIGPPPAAIPTTAGPPKSIEGMLRGFSITIPKNPSTPLTYGYEGQSYSVGQDAVKAMRADFAAQIAKIVPAKERFGGQVLVLFPPPENHQALKAGRDRKDSRYEEFKPTVLEFAKTADLAILESLKASKLFDDIKAVYTAAYQRDPNSRGFVMRKTAASFMISYEGGPEIALPNSKKSLADWILMLTPVAKEARDTSSKAKGRSA
jgi:tetratricopeptide (TPR) repeat protein